MRSLQGHEPLASIPKRLGFEGNMLSVWDACHMFKACVAAPDGGIQLSQVLLCLPASLLLLLVGCRS